MIQRLQNLPLWLRTTITVLLLSAVPLWMIFDRMRILTQGTEIVLKTEARDPRDLLKGHYARMRYEISRLPADLLQKDEKPDALIGRTVYLLLDEQEDGFWQVRKIFADNLPENSTGTFLRAHVSDAWDGKLRLKFGLERFYAPKERALEIERLGRWNRDTPMGVIVRVDAKGRPVIAGLKINDQKVYEEPLW